VGECGGIPPGRGESPYVVERHRALPRTGTVGDDGDQTPGKPIHVSNLGAGDVGNKPSAVLTW